MHRHDGDGQAEQESPLRQRPRAPARPADRPIFKLNAAQNFRWRLGKGMNTATPPFEFQLPAQMACASRAPGGTVADLATASSRLPTVSASTWKRDQPW